MPWELPGVLAARVRARRPGAARTAAPAWRAARARGRAIAFAQVAALEARIYMRNQLLRDTDWASMAHSLEVRVPLVDHRLLEACAPHVMATWARGGRGKSLLAMSPSRPLPGEIVNRRKTGFSTPIAQWLGKAKLGEGRERGGTRPAPAQSVRELAKLVLAGSCSSPLQKECVDDLTEFFNGWNSATN